MDIHKLIGKLPLRPKEGFVLPGHKYTGPYNPLSLQLDENDNPLPGHEPFNAVDAISMHHDICYRDNEKEKEKCDDKMLLELNLLEPKTTRLPIHITSRLTTKCETVYSTSPRRLTARCYEVAYSHHQ